MPAKTKTKKTSQINLIPAEGLKATTGGRILSWVLSTFRVFVIITELFVIAAFVSRFFLDAKNTDLTDEIRESQAVILSYQDLEKNFKDIHKRIDVYKIYSQDKG